MNEQDQLDRHTDPSGLVASLRHASSGLPYLGDKAAVEKIVREFAGEILTRYDEVGQGVLTPQDASQADQAQAVKLGKAFAGQDAGYAAVKGWNGPELAAQLQRVYADKIVPEDDPADVIAQRFALLVHQVYDSLRDLAGGANEDAVGQTLAAAVQKLASELVGVGNV